MSISGLFWLLWCFWASRRLLFWHDKSVGWNIENDVGGLFSSFWIDYSHLSKFYPNFAIFPKSLQKDNQLRPKSLRLISIYAHSHEKCNHIQCLYFKCFGAYGAVNYFESPYFCILVRFIFIGIPVIVFLLNKMT